LQTADTRQLERIVDEPVEPSPQDELQFQDTVEVEPINQREEGELDQSIETEETEEPQFSQFAETSEIDVPTSAETAPTSDDQLLDLEESTGEETISDDVFLDLEFEAPSPEVAATVAEAAPRTEIIPAAEVFADEAAAPAIATEERSSIENRAPVEGLSAEAIDAIARRVVEQMSDKTVREIAWEVVPELAELLIKQKLEEKK